MTALVPSDTACLASSPAQERLKAAQQLPASEPLFTGHGRMGTGCGLEAPMPNLSTIVTILHHVCAPSPGSTRRTAVWISREVSVGFLFTRASWRRGGRAGGCAVAQVNSHWRHTASEAGCRSTVASPWAHLRRLGGDLLKLRKAQGAELGSYAEDGR